MDKVKVKIYGGAILLAGGGFAAGTAAGYYWCQRALAKRLDSEVSAVKAHYRDRLDAIAKDYERGTPFVGASSDQPVEGLSDSEGEDGSWETAMGNELESADEDAGADAGQPEVSAGGIERSTAGPYTISADEFADPPEGWIQDTITWYSGDNVAVDTQEQPIPGVKKLVGQITPLMFGGVSGDPHIRYVRNEQREQDFEIILNAGKYVDLILNYGNPNRTE